MKSGIVVLCLIVLFTVISGFESYGQMNATEGLLATAKIVDDSAKRERADAIDSTVDLYLRKPAVLYFKNGAVLRGYLLPGVPEDPDTVFVEVNGEIISINFDSLSKLVIDTVLVDRVKKVANNDLKARLDGLIIRLQNEQDPLTYLIFFGVPVDSRRVSKVAIDYMVKNRGVDRRRIKWVNGGNCGKVWILELWMLQPGDAAPVAKCR